MCFKYRVSHLKMEVFPTLDITGWPNFSFQMAVTLEICNSDPMLVKLTWVWEVADFFGKCKQIAENCKQTAGN